MSTKKPVSRFRSVVSVTKPKTRDPRFDNLSGKYNEYFFKKSYEFIDTYRDNEEKLIRQKLKATKDPDQKNELSTALNILISRRQSEKNKELEKEISRTHKKREMEMVKQGKKPYYLKKNDLKQLELAERFKDIKDDRQLEKVIEKRRKHNASKAHKAMPFKRRREEE
ncbi:rRNA biogenesis protein rrp36 [Dispira simplex]|nr:rRNA biogenesis protein rrp36 [Dispira simplex]